MTITTTSVRLALVGASLFLPAAHAAPIQAFTENSPAGWGSCRAIGVPPGKIKVVVAAANMGSFNKKYLVDRGEQKITTERLTTEDDVVDVALFERRV